MKLKLPTAKKNQKYRKLKTEVSNPNVENLSTAKTIIVPSIMELAI